MLATFTARKPKRKGRSKASRIHHTASRALDSRTEQRRTEQRRAADRQTNLVRRGCQSRCRWRRASRVAAARARSPHFAAKPKQPKPKRRACMRCVCVCNHTQHTGAKKMKKHVLERKRDACIHKISRRLAAAPMHTHALIVQVLKAHLGVGHGGQSEMRIHQTVRKRGGGGAGGDHGQAEGAADLVARRRRVAAHVSHHRLEVVSWRKTRYK